MTGAVPVPSFRLGYITPHPTVDTLPYEFYGMAPPGMMLVTAGLRTRDYTHEAVEEQLPALHANVELLVARRVDRIVVSGVPIAVALGRGRMRSVLDEIERAAGVPADTDLEAIIAGIRHLGIARVAVGSRWKREVNEALRAYLAVAGIELVEVVGAGRSMRENAALDDRAGMDLALELGRLALSSAAHPDGVILPGARWVAAHAITILEGEFGRPVFLNHSAGLWSALHHHGYRDPIDGWGMLLGSVGGARRPTAHQKAR